jgi:AcrR family transcriptional regulator
VLTGPVVPTGPVPRGVHTRAGNAMGRTRAGLLDGAARAFAVHGLRATTMQSIAAAAGVAKGTLYNHFRTKDEVARTLLASELRRLAADAAGRPPAEALAGLADELAGHAVLRRLRSSDPEVLVDLLAVPADRWAELTADLAAVLGTEAAAAELPARWLLGVVLQPGRSAARHRAAEQLAAVLTARD